MKSQILQFGNMPLWIFLGLLIYMPFHVFLSHWIGSSFGILELAKVIKDPIMISGFGLLVYGSRSKLRDVVTRHMHLVAVVGLYAILSVLLLVFRSNNLQAEILGITYNLRFLVFFAYAALIAVQYGEQALRLAVKCVIVTGVIVAILGAFQVLILPDSALRSVGYSMESGTPEVFYIHNTTKDTERAYATLKDPNSFGSYLIIILFIILLPVVAKSKNVGQRKILTIGSILIVLLALYHSHSRSAWVGTAAAGLCFIIMLVRSGRYAKYITAKRAGIVFVSLFVMGLGVLFAIRNTYFYNNVILHEAEGKELTSNTIRLSAYSVAIDKVEDNPLGYGVGAAGPVSFKNAPNEPIITENYYLQLAVEVGVLGLAIFLAIILMTGKMLYGLAVGGSPTALILLCALVGITVSNFFNHIWANEAVAYAWWGLAGLVLYTQKTRISARKRV